MKKQTQLGKLGEYLVLVELLKLDIEAYPSNIKNQKGWDITVILNNESIKRIQVKITDLQNKSKNNSLKGTDKEYDFLVIVIQNVNNYSFLILGKDEVLQEKNKNIDFAVSQLKNGKYIVKDSLNKYQNKWDSLKSNT